jgi:hypothetical protein
VHTLNLGCSFITLRKSCNNQRPRCDIACFMLQIIKFYTMVFRVKLCRQNQSLNFVICIKQFKEGYTLELCTLPFFGWEVSLDELTLIYITLIYKIFSTLLSVKHVSNDSNCFLSIWEPKFQLQTF